MDTDFGTKGGIHSWLHADQSDNEVPWLTLRSDQRRDFSLRQGDQIKKTVFLPRLAEILWPERI